MNLKGFRTLIGNVVIAASAVAALKGVEVPPEEQAQVVELITQVVIGAFTLFNIVMRKFTDTSIGRSK